MLKIMLPEWPMAILCNPEKLTLHTKRNTGTGNIKLNHKAILTFVSQ